MMLAKRKKRIGISTMMLSLVLFSGIVASSVHYNYAATTGTANVKMYLNGGTVAGFTDGGIKNGASGTSFSIPAPPSKTGYTFKGWLQQGNSGIGPWGKPVWSDGELVSRPVTDLYVTAKVPASIVGTKIAKPADCQTKSGATVTRLTWTENAHYGGYYSTLGLVWNNFTIPAYSYLRCMIYAKIPVGYVLVPAIGRASTPGTTVLTAAPKYTVSPSEFVGTGEYQYYEWVMYNGNGIQDVGLFGLHQIDASLPQPSASNPIHVDIGYYNYTKCDGSAGYNVGNGMGSYKFDFTSSSSYIQDNLTAIFDPNIYNISYNANGGTSCPAMQSYGYNPSKTIALTNTIPVKAGFTFQGWARSPDATVPELQPGQSWACNIMQDTTLYALWKFSACNLESPKTLIVGSDGKASFNIKAPLTSGKINVVAPNSLIFKQINKPNVNGSLVLSGTSLTPLVPMIQGQINAPGLTAGSWISQFNIQYTFVP